MTKAHGTLLFDAPEDAIGKWENQLGYRGYIEVWKLKGSDWEIQVEPDEDSDQEGDCLVYLQNPKTGNQTTLYAGTKADSAAKGYMKKYPQGPPTDWAKSAMDYENSLMEKHHTKGYTTREKRLEKEGERRGYRLIRSVHPKIECPVCGEGNEKDGGHCKHFMSCENTGGYYPWEWRFATKARATAGYKSPSYLWMRLGDNADYEKVEGPSDAADRIRDFTKQVEHGDIKWREKYGVAIEPGFGGNNYISLYWGDEDAQPTRQLTKAERKDIETILTGKRTGGYKESPPLAPGEKRDLTGSIPRRVVLHGARGDYEAVKYIRLEEMSPKQTGGYNKPGEPYVPQPSYHLSKVEPGHGPGSLLEPPNHPRYATQTIYTQHGNSPPSGPQYVYQGRGYETLEQIDKLFKPLPYSDPLVKLWEDDLYAYFHTCYSPDGTERNASKCLTGIKPGDKPAEHHLAYLAVKKHYPDAKPRQDLIEHPPAWGKNRSETYGKVVSGHTEGYEKFYEPKLSDTGWHKDMSLEERRRIYLKAHTGDLTASYHGMDSLAKVTQDEKTATEARKDAEYFRRLIHKERETAGYKGKESKGWKPQDLEPYLDDKQKQVLFQGYPGYEGNKPRLHVGVKAGKPEYIGGGLRGKPPASRKRAGPMSRGSRKPLLLKKTGHKAKMHRRSVI